MGVILEIKSGPMAGKVISLRNGESVTIGRASGKAQFALANDTFMSGLHLAVECDRQGARVVDRKSSNGTFLNGRKLREFEATPLATGDEIKAGQTIFAVKMVADEKLGATGPAKAVSAPPDQPQSPASSPRQQRYGSSQPSEPPLQPPPGRQVVPPRPEPRVSPPPAEEPAGGGASGFFSDPEKPQTPPQADERRAPASVGRVRPPDPPDRPRPLDAQNALGRSPAPPLEGQPQLHAIPGLPQPEAPPVSCKPADDFAQRPVERRPARPRGAAFTIMGWSFPAAPADWQVQEGFGLQRAAQEEFPSSLAATEEVLGGITLQQFVESQISTLRGYLRDSRIEPAMPPHVGGADETMAVDVQYSTKEGKQVLQRWIYARSGSCVGMLTVKALASELPQVLQSLQPLLDGAAFQATVQV